MSPSRLLIVLLLLATAIPLASSKTIQVPYVSSEDTLNLRLQELQSVDKVFNVFGYLDRIYKKEVYELSADGSQTEFPACYEEPPQANFWAYSELLIQGRKMNKDGLIYDFDQVKYPRNLIDVEVYENKIYYAKEDGSITIAQISSDISRITAKKRMQTQDSKLAEGNIVILPNATDGQKVGFGVFMTRNQAVLFDLEGDNFTTLTNFKARQSFESVISIEGNYLAAAFAEDGCNIFSIDFALKQLKVQSSFNSQSLNLKNINIQDLAYDSVRKILFILDHNTGVTPIQLLFKGQSLQVRSTSSTIKNNFCNVIYYDSYNDELYLSCRELHKYLINNWPLFTEKVLPRQEISIREISSNKGVVALVGRNVFELVSQERKVAVYDDKLLDKLILKDKLFVSGNQNYFLAGRYEVISPMMSCSAINESSIGKHNVLFKVTAACNPDYLKQIGFSTSTIAKDDKCVYSIYQNVKIWRAKLLNVKIFMILTLIIGVLGLGVLTWWGCSYLDLRKLKNNLHHYKSLEDGQEGQSSSVAGEKPLEAVIEMKENVQKASDKQGRHELNEDIDVPGDLHDIE